MGENAGVETGGQQVSQGQSGTGNLGQQQAQGQSPYAQYLNNLPETVRPMVEPIFKQWDTDTTQRFQGLQEQLSGYEPYQELFDNYEAEGLSQAAQLVEMLNDPQGAEQIFRQLAQVLGYDIEGGDQQQQQMNPQDPYNEPQQQFNLAQDPAFQQLQQGLGTIAQQIQQQQEQAQMQQELQSVESEFGDLMSQHFGEQEVPVEVEKMILTIAAQTGDLPGAFDMYKQSVGQQAQQLNRPGQTAPIVGGGANGSMPSNNIDLAHATPEQRKALALAALRASNAQRT
jgi:hypothetical protein